MIVLQFVLAQLFEIAEHDGDRVRQIALIANHKSVGMTVLILAIARLLWRFRTGVPALPKTIPKWQMRASGATHWALYLALFAMPLTGWLMSSASAYSVSWFGLFTWPDLIAPDKDLRGLFANMHDIAGKVLAAIALLHIAAALKHHWKDKDDVLKRMMSRVSLVLFVAVIAVGLWSLIPTSNKAQADIDPAAAPIAQDISEATDIDDTQVVGEDVQADATTETTPTSESTSTAAPQATEIDSVTPAAETTKVPATATVTSGTEPAPPPAEIQPETPAPTPEPPLWNIDFDNSFIRFVAVQAGADFTGEWRQWQADMRFQPDQLAQSRFRVSIATDGVSTNDDDRDSTLQDSEWFNAKAYPNIIFETGQIKPDGDAFAAAATLTLKGNTYPVNFRFSVANSGATRTLTGESTLDRLAINVGTGEWTDTEWVGQFVNVNVRVVATVSDGG